MSGRWLITIAAAVLIISTVLLVKVSLNQKKQRNTQSNSLFQEYSRKSGLSERESQILANIAKKAGLKENESIFTMVDAFEKSVNIMLQENINNQQKIVS